MQNILLASTVGLVAVGAIGLRAAASPDDAGVIHACVNDATRVARIIDTDSSSPLNQCLTGPGPLRETPVTWNAAGPPGPEGEPGRPGTGVEFALAGMDAVDASGEQLTTGSSQDMWQVPAGATVHLRGDCPSDARAINASWSGAAGLNLVASHGAYNGLASSWEVVLENTSGLDVEIDRPSQVTFCLTIRDL